MDPVAKQKWIAALRSREYIQGTGALRGTGEKEDQFCCLGVLCDLWVKENAHGRWHEDGSILGTSNFIPKEIREWAGLHNHDPSVHPHPHEANKETLSGLNDMGHPFTTIADYIEEQL